MSPMVRDAILPWRSMTMVEGTALGGTLRKDSATCPAWSYRLGYGILKVRWNAAALSLPSLTSTPTNCTPDALVCSAIFCSAGASARQGPHHDAQKFTTTTLPLKEAVSSGLPWTEMPFRSGAAIRLVII